MAFDIGTGKAARLIRESRRRASAIGTGDAVGFALLDHAAV
ncbi:hypothetical protein AB0B66_08350 [Catellatospora sp. NPDC049111]